MASLLKYRKAKCRYCDKATGLHVHHVIPLSEGGTNEPHNLMTLCKDHHWKMHKLYGSASFSELTKAGMARRKAEGAVFGNRTNLREAQAKGNATIKARADAFALRLRPMIQRMRKAGMTIRAIANEFNTIGVPTAKGGLWRDGTVSSILSRPLTVC